MAQEALKPQEEMTCCVCGHVVSQEKAYCDSCFEDKIIECDKCGNTINQEEERFCDECIGQVKDQLAEALKEVVDFRKQSQAIIEDTLTMIGKLSAFYNRKRLFMVGNITTSAEQEEYDFYGDIVDNMKTIKEKLLAQLEVVK